MLWQPRSGAVKSAVMVHLQGQVEHFHSQLAPSGAGKTGVPAALRRLVRKYAGEEATEQLLGPAPQERRRPSLRGADGGCHCDGLMLAGATPTIARLFSRGCFVLKQQLQPQHCLLGSCAGCQGAGEPAVHSSKGLASRTHMVGAPVLGHLPGHRVWEQRKLSSCNLSHAGGACQRLLSGCPRVLNCLLQVALCSVALRKKAQQRHQVTNLASRLHAGSELRLQRSSSGVPFRPRLSAAAAQTPRLVPSPRSTGAGAVPPAEVSSFPSRDQPQTGVPSRDPQPSRSTPHSHPLASDPASPLAVEQHPARQSVAPAPQEQPTALHLRRSAADPSPAGSGSQQVSGLAAWPSAAPSEAAMALSAHPGPPTPFVTQATGPTAGQPPRQMETDDRYASGVTRQGWFEGTTHDFGDTPR